MNENSAIAEGVMTVGQLAKRMKTTVRTLQYYDRFGLLSPSEQSSGGRRLYTRQDLVKLHQILSLKYLGFSLADIKEQLVSLETPEDVEAVLAEQLSIVRRQIDSLTGVAQAIETLRAEIAKIKTVNWTKYADIIALLQAGNQNYWVIKHFDEEMFEHITANFDEDRGLGMITKLQQMCTSMSQLAAAKVPPDSLEGQAVAADFWGFVTEFTGGDMSMLPQLMEFSFNRDGWDDAWQQTWTAAEPYLSAVLEVYFAKQGINPFEGVQP